MITSEEIKRRLWDGANNLRGTMDASRYKDYMLGLMFYKFLSDKTLQTFKETAGLPDNANVLEEYRNAHEEYGEELETMIQQILGYHVTPDHLYQTWEEDIENGDFELSEVMDSLNAFERSIAATDDSDDFKGLFSSSVIDLTNTALGSDLNKRSKNIRDLIGLFADLNMVDLQNGDVLGDAYEYLISQFASDSGKKAGEFYTPSQVSEVIAQIIARTTKIKSIYDPTVGSGSLLLTVGKHLSKDERKDLHYYGQEYITATFNLTRMNLLLHGVRPENMSIRNGNTMASDWPEDPNRPGEGVQFDAVVMNPPYSDKSWNKHEDKPLKVSDPRFSEFGALPPESKGDFAYLMHGLYHLGQQGTMGIVLPHGVLFRGDTEGLIRQRLIEKNYIDAVIGLPSNLFTNTGIPVAVLILKKNRNLTDPLLIIDASHDFIKVGKNNVLRERDIAKIVDTYVNKQEIPGYSHLASQKEIKKNDYNLNIPRYIEQKSTDLIQDVDGHLLGGIPQKDIADLKILNQIAPEIISLSIQEIRPGYVLLTQKINKIKRSVLNSDRVNVEIDKLSKVINNYLENLYNQIKNVNQNTAINELKEKYFDKLKDILGQFSNVNKYDGYQIMAEIWSNYLNRGLELISKNGFYSTGRTRLPNMVEKTRKGNKVTEQDGWVPAITSNNLIKQKLYKDELSKIDKITAEDGDIQSKLDEILNSLSEEDGEYTVLNDDNTKFNSTSVNSELKIAYANIEIPEVKSLEQYLEFLDTKPKKEDKINYMIRNSSINWDKIEKVKDGSVGKSGAKNYIKELKETFEFPEDSFEYKLVQVQKLLKEQSAIHKQLNSKVKEINDAVYDKIENLTDSEIDELVYDYWFGDAMQQFINLIKSPIEAELARLEELNSTYSETVEELDQEINCTENELNNLLNNLVTLQ